MKLGKGFRGGRKKIGKKKGRNGRDEKNEKKCGERVIGMKGMLGKLLDEGKDIEGKRKKVIKWRKNLNKKEGEVDKCREKIGLKGMNGGDKCGLSEENGLWWEWKW